MALLPCALSQPAHQLRYIDRTRTGQLNRSLLNDRKRISAQLCVSKPEEDRCGQATMATQRMAVCRRELMACILFGPMLRLEFSAAADPGASELSVEPNTALQIDDINAYSYGYPLKLPKQSYRLRWVESRKPERYSSAAPLSPDARERIVSERLDIKDNIVISVSVGPPNSAFLKQKEKDLWDAMDVAKSVLSDKSTARMTSGQRVAELEIVDAHTQEVDHQPYWYYEYLVQKSPTISGSGKDVYRHSIAVTAEREGYLYSLNASTLDSRWTVLEPLLKETVASFQLLPPTKEYVPPYKDPWRFW